jgi:hypothetical protein
VNRDDYLRNRTRFKRSNYVLPRSNVEPIAAKRLDAEAKPQIDEVWEIHDKAEHKLSLPNVENVLVGIALLVIGVAIVAFGYFYQQNNNKQRTPATTSTQNTTKTKPKPQAKQPGFTVYYPINLPYQMTIDKPSIVYSKDSFGFSVFYQGQKAFVITEQAAGDNFNYKAFKTNLVKPQDFDAYIGTGTIGSIGSSVATGIITNDQTLILINCFGDFCQDKSRDLARSLQINTDPSLYKKYQP